MKKKESKVGGNTRITTKMISIEISAFEWTQILTTEWA